MNTLVTTSEVVRSKIEEDYLRGLGHIICTSMYKCTRVNEEDMKAPVEEERE